MLPKLRFHQEFLEHLPRHLAAVHPQLVALLFAWPCWVLFRFNLRPETFVYLLYRQARNRRLSRLELFQFFPCFTLEMARRLMRITAPATATLRIALARDTSR